MSIRRVFPVAGLALAAGLFFAGTMAVPSSVSAGETDCAKLKHAKVKAACKKGGKKAVKKLMKDVVKKSRKAGDAKTCLDCHKDLKSFARTKNADADLKKFLK